MTPAPSSVLEREHREIVEAFESFVRRELDPLAADLAEAGELPPLDLRAYTRKRSAALGFYAGGYPERWGGADMPLSAVLMLHAAAYRGGNMLAPYALGGSDGPSPLLCHGTPEQIERYLVPLIRGELTRCLALTEPQAGSDAFRLTTKAVPDGDGFRLTGHKTFVSNADHADIVLVVAATGAGATAFVLPMDHPGLRLGQRYEGMSGEPLFEIVLDDVALPLDRVIGGAAGVGAATAFAMDSLAHGRLIVAAQSTGIAEHAQRLAVGHARQRRAFGQAIGGYQHIQEHLVRNRQEIESAKLLTLACARLVEDGAEAGEHAALAKLAATEAATHAVDRALQIHGATGWVRGHPLELLYRHVRSLTIIEGTSEIQKVIVARSMGLG